MQEAQDADLLGMALTNKDTHRCTAARIGTDGSGADRSTITALVCSCGWSGDVRSSLVRSALDAWGDHIAQAGAEAPGAPAAG